MRTLIKLAAPILALALAACGQSGQSTGGATAADDPRAFHVIAGSELKDLEPQVKAEAAKRGIDVVFDNAGTLDVIDRVNAGEKADAAWVANGAYADMALRAKPAASTKTMYSQVLVGVKPDVAHALGWDARAPTWADIGRAAAAGRFRYAMTSPAASNSGLSALVSVATSFAGKGDGLASIDVNAPQLQGFLKGQQLTSGSSGWLADAYVKDNSQLDGIVNYESALFDLKRKGLPLDIIRPADGAVTSDYPIMLVNPARRADYDKIVALLSSAAMQRTFAAAGRRSIDPTVRADPGLSADPAIDLPFPAKLDAVDALVGAYLDKLRRPTRSWFILDRSGSMEGERMDALKAAMSGLVNGDPTSLAGRFARLADRETTMVLTFSDVVDPSKTYAIDAKAPQNRAKLLNDVQGIEASGSTDLYDAVATALRQAIAEHAKDPTKVYSIVLMTDGEANEGMDLDAFRSLYASMPEAKRAVKVFPILFGEGAVDQMQALADMTGGRTFDARKGDLAAVFRDIRGYQ